MRSLRLTELIEESEELESELDESELDESELDEDELLDEELELLLDEELDEELELLLDEELDEELDDELDTMQGFGLFLRATILVHCMLIASSIFFNSLLNKMFSSLHL